MRLATIDSVATTQTLRDNLQNLGVFAVTVKGDIDKINAEFDMNYSQLLARGATLDDPIGILFDAYLLVPCYNFTKYISTKHDEYLDGNLTSLTHEAMMSMAKRKFDFLKTKGKWGAKSPDDEKIVAMAAEINSLKGKLKLDPKLSTIAGEEKKDDGSKKKKNKKNTSNKREQKKDEAWKKEPPKAGESKTGKQVGKYTFNWCEHHMAWTVHKPADCNLGKQRKDEQKKPKANSATVAAAATSAINPHFASLLAAMANLDQNEWRFAPAYMYYMLVACMVGPLDTRQQIATYLFLYIIPFLLYHLVYLVLPEDPMSFSLLEKTIAQTSAWQLRGHPHNARPKRFKCFKKPKKKMFSEEIQDKTLKH